MFWKKQTDNDKITLDYLVDKIAVQLDDEDDFLNDNSEKLIERMKTLVAMRNESKNNLDPNTILSVSGTIGGIILILLHERTGVITTKAMSFIRFR